MVGATDRPGSYGGETLRNLDRAGFPGVLVGVNPGRAAVDLPGRSVPCAPTLADLDGPVDAVVVATRADTVPGVVRQARELGCGGAVVYAAGFAESDGDVGAARQEALLAAAAGWPVLGPNGNGFVSVAARAPLWGDAVRLPEPAGPVALVSQSGNLGVVALAHRGGLDLHTVVSLGNAAVVDAPAVLGHLAGTDGVRVVALYLEQDGDGAALAQALARCAEHDVRVAVLKVGRSPAGRAAGEAHTAALAGDQRVFAALLAEAGAVQVTEPVELLETARALARLPRDRRGALVVTSSGGDAAMAADVAADRGARLTAPSLATVAALRAVLPATARPGNPLDHTNLVWADPPAVAAATAALASDPDAGVVLYLQDEPPGLPPDLATEWAATRQGGLDGAAAAARPALLVATTPGQEPAGAVAGLGPVMAAVAALQASAPDAERLRAVGRAAARLRERDPSPLAGPAALDEAAAKELLRAAGVPVPAGLVAASPAEAAGVAATHAGRLGERVVVKLVAPGLTHKSELGAVELDVPVAAVPDVAARLLALPAAQQGARVLVERMVPPGVEALVAARSDGVVPVLALGLGGVWAEALDDVVLVPLPAAPRQVLDALATLRGAPLLLGGRGRDGADVDALAALAAAVGDLLLEQRLRLVELNPVVVGPPGRGAVAVDAVVVAGLDRSGGAALA